MKKIYAILAVAAVAACATFAVSSYSGRDSFFEANVEALTSIEASGRAICYSVITNSTSSRTLECVSCVMTDGVGATRGGYCKW